MTEEEREFAAGNHNLILGFLRASRRDPEDYYDIAAWGFLIAVMRYFRVPRLRKYPFSSVAWKSMKHSVAAFHRTEARRLDTERRYAETARSQTDLFSELDARLLLHDLAANVDARQYELASMRLQGYSLAEIVRAQGIPRQRVSNLLKNLYRVYLKLYKE